MLLMISVQIPYVDIQYFSTFKLQSEVNSTNEENWIGYASTISYHHCKHNDDKEKYRIGVEFGSIEARRRVVREPARACQAPQADASGESSPAAVTPLGIFELSHTHHSHCPVFVRAFEH